MKTVLLSILLIIYGINLFAVSQKQQYEIAYMGIFPVNLAEWTIEVKVLDANTKVEKLKLMSFVLNKCYLQALGTMLFLTFDLGQYPSEIAVNDEIDIKIAWKSPVTFETYFAEGTYLAGKKSSENLNVFKLVYGEGLALTLVKSLISINEDFQLCGGSVEGQELSRELTVSGAPEGARVCVFEGGKDITSKFVVTGLTGLRVKPADFTENSDVLRVVLMGADGVTELAEAPFRVNVAPGPVLKLSGDFEGKKAGDELLFEAMADDALLAGDYYWFVNDRPVNGGRGWLVSGKLNEGDVVKCVVDGGGTCGERVESNKLLVRYAGKGQLDNIGRSGGWDNGGFLVPNIITPNGDGMNDTWKLDFLQDYPDHLVSVYDYSGRIVYRTKYYRNDWEGRIDNVITYGVYTCVIDLGTGKTLKTWLFVKNNDAR